MNRKIGRVVAFIAGCIITGIILVQRKKAKGDEREEGEPFHQQGFYEKYIKRCFDFLCAMMALLILSPVMGIIALLVYFKLGRPVIFKQKRPGLNGEVFELWKFRTMTDEYGKNGVLLSDEERLTNFGKKLRSSSLDELPELFNVLKGDMSLVGPRPLLMEYLPLYNEKQAKRHEVRPGITGLAQVHGRNSISWEERFEWDVKYVEGLTLWGDMKIILSTVFAVLRHEGINSKTSATMEKFTG